MLQECCILLCKAYLAKFMSQGILIPESKALPTRAYSSAFLLVSNV
ncbi:unnamed protein product, partial [Larinioides sclopetarius]